MGGAPALPTASTPGFTTLAAVYGPDVACYCQAQWLAVFRRLLAHRGLADITVWQLVGANAESAGTHTGGGVTDWKGISKAHASLAREMGAGATWPRDWTNNQHTHSVLTGCAHNAPARYQIDAVRKRRDGLGGDGLQGPDPLPAPSVWRTWREGIAWAEAQMTPAPITPSPEEDDVSAADVWGADSGAKYSDGSPIPMGSLMVMGYYRAASAEATAKAALEVAKVAAQKGEPLTAQETEDAVKAALTDAVVDVNVNFPVAPPPPPAP